MYIVIYFNILYFIILILPPLCLRIYYKLYQVYTWYQYHINTIYTSTVYTVIKNINNINMRIYKLPKL